MRVLGIRVEPKKSTFIVIEKDIDDNYNNKTSYKINMDMVNCITSKDNSVGTYFSLPISFNHN